MLKIKITAWSHRLCILHSNAPKCLSSNPQQDMNDSKENTEKAINTINSFVRYSKGLWRKADPGVKQSLKQSLISSLTVFRSDGVTRDLHSLTTKAVVEEVWDSHRVSLSDCKLRPVLWEGQQGHTRLSFLRWKQAGSLDLGHVVVGEQSLLSTKSSCPPPGGIWPTDTSRSVVIWLRCSQE